MKKTKWNGIGILTFALNSKDCDYEKLAYLMALSYLATNKHRLPLAVVVNDDKKCFDKLKNVYQHVIPKINNNVVNEMHHEALLLHYSPFAETIKIESDMLLTCDINHWIKHFRLWDMCFTNTVYDFNNNVADDKKYRKYIKLNNLPNIYNGIMYARYCKNTYEFYNHVNFIFNNWQKQIQKYRMFDNFPASTDFAMAMACNEIKDLNFGHNPTGLPGFIHAKPWITHRSEQPWHKEMKWSIVDPYTVIVNGIKADWPVHYYDKHFCTEKLIEQYEEAI